MTNSWRLLQTRTVSLVQMTSIRHAAVPYTDAKKLFVEITRRSVKSTNISQLHIVGKLSAKATATATRIGTIRKVKVVCVRVGGDWRHGATVGLTTFAFGLNTKTKTKVPVYCNAHNRHRP
ncbi:hypothetical protein AN958_08850 [Leucoagaricus sp. SymC.cos]|nr:hypothetical protein AN958_08850 [Leucoagaricus sp. SymC.cos]